MNFSLTPGLVIHHHVILAIRNCQGAIRVGLYADLAVQALSASTLSGSWDAGSGPAPGGASGRGRGPGRRLRRGCARRAFHAGASCASGRHVRGSPSARAPAAFARMGVGRGCAATSSLASRSAAVKTVSASVGTTRGRPVAMPSDNRHRAEDGRGRPLRAQFARRNHKDHVTTAHQARPEICR